MSNGRAQSGGIGGGLVPEEGFLGSSLLEQADLLGDLTDLDVRLGLSWGGPSASGSGFPDPSRFGLQSAAPIQPPPSTIIPNSSGVTPSIPASTTLPQFSTLTADTLTGNNPRPLSRHSHHNQLFSTIFTLPSSSLSQRYFSVWNPRGTSISRRPVRFPTANATSSPNLGFAVRAEGTVTINGNSDFDGDPSDLSDDALIYAGNGFTINGRPALPVQLDEFGQPVLDGNGRPLLVENAVAVSANYSTLNAPNNTYGNLVPPQIVEEQVVEIQDFDTIKSETLADQIPAGTTPIDFNPYQNPLNNADWAQHFPAGGTPEQPTVVKVSGWGLNIPGGVTIENTVIELENGYLNFNGNGHQLNNVTLVTHNGGMNLGNIQGTDLTILSSQSINMNGGARFGGTSLIATGNNQSIHFNGATQTTDPDDVLTVISQRDITFNGSTDTRGHFLSVNNFTLNGKFHHLWIHWGKRQRHL